MPPLQALQQAQLQTLQLQESEKEIMTSRQGN
jgi:hypothetical protein